LPAPLLYLRPELFFEEDFFVELFFEELFFDEDLRPVLFLLEDFFEDDFRPEDFFLLLAFLVAILGTTSREVGALLHQLRCIAGSSFFKLDPASRLEVYF
jgi:hypothetical protein